jgi:hypothetical protein
LMSREMQSQVSQLIEEIRERSLLPLGCDMARLICLSSTRDYNTGRYQHEGWLWRNTEADSNVALKTLHKEVFENLLASTLENFVREMVSFLDMTQADRQTAIRIWQDLEPYRTTVPEGCGELSRELFFSNVRMALSILQSRQVKAPHDSQESTPRR